MVIWPSWLSIYGSNLSQQIIQVTRWDLIGEYVAGELIDHVPCSSVLAMEVLVWQTWAHGLTDPLQQL